MLDAKEQNEIFARVSGVIGPCLAAFCLCAVCDLPFDSESAAEASGWGEYVSGMAGDGGSAGFADGETDVNAALLAGMDAGERWAVVWGKDYSEAECRQLDDLYRTMTAQLDAAGGVIDKQQEDTARTCARMALQRNKLIRSNDKDDISMAKNLDEMIRKNLQDCNMRKADVLPTQAQRLDGFVDALKRRTGLDAEMTKEQVLNVFYRWCKKNKYAMTTDAADHMLLSIQRTMAKNDDLPEPMELEPGMSLEGFGSEFAEEPNEQETEAYRYLGYVRDGAGGK